MRAQLSRQKHLISAANEEQLSALRAQLDKREDALTWVYSSRTWRVAATLRSLFELRRALRSLNDKLRQLLHFTPRQVFNGFIDSPVEGARSRGDLEIVGWVFSVAAPVVRVEAFLDDFYLCQLNYGVKRVDVAEAYPEQAPVTCGFHDKVLPVGLMSGPRVFTLRVYDEAGNEHRFARSIVVEPEHSAPAGHEQFSEASDQIDAACATTPNADASLHAQLTAVISEFKNRTERDPAILDCCQDIANLSQIFPELAIFSPPATDASTSLPYLDQSIDVVIVSSSDSAKVAEAHRVAANAVIQVGQVGQEEEHESLGGKLTITVEWKDKTNDFNAQSVSIIIPVFNKVTFTEGCLEQLLTTLPSNFVGEIIVVDDASTDVTPSVLERWVQSDKRIKVLRNKQNLGFISSCNRGAETASGEVLVFLNNDTLPRPGWLQPLLRVLREHANAGAVGGKLIYPDGMLQEAGAVIFSDGTGCNFGKHDRLANAPLYSFVREVDYCSGALLATPRALFLKLGGFDTRFAPAYYEDTDYCLTLRERGYRVFYQPESVLVHFEGVSSGTDTGSGVKSYQKVNRAKFVDKWRHVLGRQPSAPDKYDFTTWHALSDVGGRKMTKPKALVCAPKMPEYDREGGSRRIFHLIQFLRDLGWSVTFIAEDGSGGERYAHALQQMGVATFASLKHWSVGPACLIDPKTLISTGEYDLVLTAFWDHAEKYLPLVRSLSPPSKFVVDTIDLHFLRNSRSTFCQGEDGAGQVRRKLGPRYADEIVRELNVYAAADAVLTVSQKEADLIADFTGNMNLAREVPDTDDLPASDIPFAERKGVLFVGNFRHPPNVQAVEYLCREVLPRIAFGVLADHPVYIVGNGLTEKIIEYGRGLENVLMVGWVPTILPYLQRARASVIPLLYGAGTKRKLMQAMMVGTPSVSTRIGIEGLDLIDGVHVLIADDPTKFADSLATLLTDEALWERLMHRGREHVKATHGREAARGTLESVLSQILDTRSKLDPGRT